MKKVLILGVASVQMDAIIQLKNMGCIVYACAMADDGPGSKYADHFEMLNFSDIKALINYIKKENFDCVYSVGSDLAMPISAELSEKLNLPHFVSSKSASICNHKNEMRSFLGTDFEWNIQYQVLRNKDERIIVNFPFIMKPSDSQGQRGVRLIKNESYFMQEFENTKSYSRSGNVILEEYLYGNELSVNAYLVDGKVAFAVSSDRVTWPQFDVGLINKHVVPSENLSSMFQSDLSRLVSDTAEKLNIFNGPLYFQIKTKNGKPKIIEVTPRLDGCHMWNVLNYYTGVNLLKLTFEHLLFGKTEELNNLKPFDKKYISEYLCQAPNTPADYSVFIIPDYTLYSFNYYKTGDNVKAVNGRFEKIGYFIVEQ